MKKGGVIQLIKGIIISFRDRKYGYIRQENGHTTFFHISSYWNWRLFNGEIIPRKSPRIGDGVYFLIGIGRKNKPEVSLFMYEKEYLLPETRNREMARACLYIIHKIRNKIIFMGTYIVSSCTMISNPIILTSGRIIECGSIEACIACIAWAAIRYLNIDKKDAAKRVCDVIMDHKLDIREILRVIQILDNEGKYRNISAKELCLVFQE